jgi:predicted metalloendopeptidase
VGRAQLINPDTFENKKIIEAYKKFIEDSVKLIADTASDISTSLKNDINSLVNFEMRLANKTADRASRSDRENLYGNKTNILEFMNTYSDIPLNYIENKVFDGLLHKIDVSEGLIVYDRDYFASLGQILKETDVK